MKQLFELYLQKDKIILNKLFYEKQNQYLNWMKSFNIALVSLSFNDKYLAGFRAF